MEFTHTSTALVAAGASPSFCSAALSAAAAAAAAAAMAAAWVVASSVAKATSTEEAAKAGGISSAATAGEDEDEEEALDVGTSPTNICRHLAKGSSFAAALPLAEIVEIVVLLPGEANSAAVPVSPDSFAPLLVSSVSIASLRGHFFFLRVLC
jgi:hypothetical protein